MTLWFWFRPFKISTHSLSLVFFPTTSFCPSPPHVKCFSSSAENTLPSPLAHRLSFLAPLKYQSFLWNLPRFFQLIVIYPYYKFLWTFICTSLMELSSRNIAYLQCTILFVYFNLCTCFIFC